jgi:hypothetical protein
MVSLNLLLKYGVDHIKYILSLPYYDILAIYYIILYFLILKKKGGGNHNLYCI